MRNAGLTPGKAILGTPSLAEKKKEEHENMAPGQNQEINQPAPERDSTHAHAPHIVVHRAGQEGTILVCAADGEIVTPIDFRPDWAEGLVVAMLAERLGFYQKRVGPKAAEELRRADAIAFEDLGWIGMTDHGSVEIEPDSDVRADRVAAALGVDREAFDTEQDFKNVVAEVEIDMDFSRTVEENERLYQEVQEDMGRRQEDLQEESQEAATGRPPKG